MRTRADNLILGFLLAGAAINLGLAYWLEHWWNWVAVLICLASEVFCARMQLRRLSYTKAILPPEPVKPFMLEPLDEFDMFCTCPSCYWLGNHAIEVKPPRMQYEPVDGKILSVGTERFEPYEGYQDDSYVIGTWQSPTIRRINEIAARPPDYGWIAHRTCYMCNYTWKTPASAPKELK